MLAALCIMPQKSSQEAELFIAFRLVNAQSHISAALMMIPATVE
jgi:hypothetical protein